MQNLITQYTPQLEQDLIALHTGNIQAKEWFSQSVKSILESQTVSAFSKADKISEAFENLDLKLTYIKEQQKLLSTLKKQIETAKVYAKEEVANTLLSLGVSKLEGLKVSSITASKATDKSVAKLVVLDEDELLNRGYFKVELDREAIERDLLSADKRDHVQDYADMSIELTHKRASIRINKRKSLATDELSSIAA